ncbi:hypothetical protein T10_171, partial [Trichinella papuae]
LHVHGTDNDAIGTKRPLFLSIETGSCGGTGISQTSRWKSRSCVCSVLVWSLLLFAQLTILNTRKRYLPVRLCFFCATVNQTVVLLMIWMMTMSLTIWMKKRI